jgi:predicted nucleotidyltransferase
VDEGLVIKGVSDDNGTGDGSGREINPETSMAPHYIANWGNAEFHRTKKAHTAEALRSCGLIAYLFDACLPSAIILYGSASRGEDMEGSDIDLFVQSKEKKPDLEKYEKALGRKIHILFQPDFGKLGKELRNNIINGSILYGYLNVF